MAGIDASRPFRRLRIGVLTVTDTRNVETDTSGAALAERLEQAGHELADRRLVRDDIPAIRKIVEAWIADPSVDAVITTGGTGLTGRDLTIEALSPLFEKTIDGFSALFHKVSYDSVGLSTIASRATAGVAAGTVIFCLPGSTGAVKDGWDHIIRDQLDSRYRPCNLVELMPRLRER